MFSYLPPSTLSIMARGGDYDQDPCTERFGKIRMINGKQVLEYKDTVKTKAENLILIQFPKKIVELNSLLETKQFIIQDLSEVHQPLNIPVPDPIVLNRFSLARSRGGGGGGSAVLQYGAFVIPAVSLAIGCWQFAVIWLLGFHFVPSLLTYGCGDGGPAKKRVKVDHENCVDEATVSGTKVMALTSGVVPCNKTLSELIHIVKPHIRQLVEDSNLLKMWISYMIPKIEDGNNFGVSIQEDTLAEIQSVESEAATFFDQISRYYVSRGKIVSKVAKYPHIEDYRRAVQELDEKEYLSLWLVMCEIRNRYCTLHDIVIKNMEKIKKPRTSNTDSLY